MRVISTAISAFAFAFIFVFAFVFTFFFVLAFVVFSFFLGSIKKGDRSPRYLYRLLAISLTEPTTLNDCDSKQPKYYVVLK